MRKCGNRSETSPENDVPPVRSEPRTRVSGGKYHLPPGRPVRSLRITAQAEVSDPGFLTQSLGGLYAFLIAERLHFSAWRKGTWRMYMETQYWCQPRKKRQDDLGQPRAGRPCSQAVVAPHNPPGCSLEVVVIHTTQRGTLAALKAAAGLAKELSARIRLLVPQVVPYALPLTLPPVSADFIRRQFQTLALGARIETRIEVLLCRDKWQVLESVLSPRALVVLGGRRSWWPTRESRLANRLRHLGHHVVFVDQAEVESGKVSAASPRWAFRKVQVRRDLATR